MYVHVCCVLQVKEEILDVEEPLIEGQLMDIDQQLKRATDELNWTSESERIILSYRLH